MGTIVRGAILVGLGLTVLACRRGGPERGVPSGTPPPAPAACVSAPPAGDEPSPPDPDAALFPALAGELSLDSHADVLSFGGAAQPPLASACGLLASDCGKLDELGLRKVMRLSYVGPVTSHARVAVTRLRFDAAESAYAYFTGRIGEAAEAGKPIFSPIVAPGAAVFGDTTLLAWKADQFLELAFSDDRLSPEQSVLRSAELLPPLARALVGRLPGEATLPLAVRLLPQAAQKPLSIRFDRFDLAELPGVGPGARALYEDGGEAYELGLLVRADFDAAEDVLETIRKLPGAKVLKNAPYRATRVVQLDEKTGRRTAWFFGQRDAVVVGVGAELEPSRSLRRDAPERDPKLRRLKLVLDRLRR